VLTRVRSPHSIAKAQHFVRAVVLAVLVAAPIALVGSGAQAATSGGTRPTGAIYVTNLNENTVSAIDIATHHVTVISSATHAFKGPLGIAVTPDATTALVTNSLGNTVTPIYLKASPPKVGVPIKVGSGPAAIAITPNGNIAYVTNFNSNSVTPINLTTTPPTPEHPIPVGPGPWSIAASPDGKYVCVSNSESNTVSIIMAGRRSVTTLSVGGRPQAIAINPNAYTAYVANGNDITPINLRANPARVEAAIPMGVEPVGIAITPDGATAYSANANNTVTPLDLLTNPPTPGAAVAIGTISQPDGIAISTDGSTAYTADASNTVTPVNLKTSPVSAETPIFVGAASFGIAIESDQAPIARLRVTTSAAGKQTVLDASTSTSPDGKIVRYAWNFGDGTTAVTRTSKITHVYQHPGSYVASVTVTSAGGTSLATTYTGQTVSNNGSGRARADQSFQIVALARLSPPAGSPGMAVALRDVAFTGSCNPVYVLFDSKLVAQVTPIGQLVYDKHLVIPGNATIGHHTVSLACSPLGPAVTSVSFNVVATANHLSEFSVAMPTLGEMGRSLPGAGVIGIIMLLMGRIISAGFPSEWLDRTYEENRERFSRPLRRRFPRLFLHHSVEHSLARRILGGTTLFGVFAAFGGFINSILDPAFGFNQSSLWLFLGQCIGIGVISVTVQLPTAFSALRQGRKVHLQILAGGLVIAVVCVAASKAIGLSPGYCYGLIATFLILPQQNDEERGRLHAIGSGLVLAISTGAFFLSIPLFKMATSSSPSPLVLILVPALEVIFLEGFASLAFGMFPLPFLPGRHVAKWNETIWLAISGMGLIGFVGVLLTPGSGSDGEVHHVGLVPIVVAFVVFALISLGAITYFHFHPTEEAEGVQFAGPDEAGGLPVAEA